MVAIGVFIPLSAKADVKINIATIPFLTSHKTLKPFGGSMAIIINTTLLMRQDLNVTAQNLVFEAMAKGNMPSTVSALTPSAVQVAAALKVGRLIGVSYLVYGILKKNGKKIDIAASLADVKKGIVIHTLLRKGISLEKVEEVAESITNDILQQIPKKKPVPVMKRPVPVTPPAGHAPLTVKRPVPVTPPTGHAPLTVKRPVPVTPPVGHMPPAVKTMGPGNSTTGTVQPVGKVEPTVGSNRPGGGRVLDNDWDIVDAKQFYAKPKIRKNTLIIKPQISPERLIRGVDTASVREGHVPAHSGVRTALSPERRVKASPVKTLPLIRIALFKPYLMMRPRISYSDRAMLAAMAASKDISGVSLVPINIFPHWQQVGRLAHRSRCQYAMLTTAYLGTKSDQIYLRMRFIGLNARTGNQIFRKIMSTRRYVQMYEPQKYQAAINATVSKLFSRAHKIFATSIGRPAVEKRPAPALGYDRPDQY